MFNPKSPTTGAWVRNRCLRVVVLLVVLVAASLAVPGPAFASTTIQNPSFEGSLSPWTTYKSFDGPIIWSNTQWHRSGTLSAGITCPSSDPVKWAMVSQRIGGVEAGHMYTLGSWFVTDRNRDAVQMEFYFYDQNGRALAVSEVVDGSQWSAGADSWTPMRVTATAPAGATGASIHLLLHGGTYNGGGSTGGCVVFDDVTMVEQMPVIDSITPASGYVGQTVVVNGRYFGTTEGQVWFGLDQRYPATVISWSDTQVSVVVPPEVLDNGPTPVTVENETGESLESVYYNVVQTPPAALSVVGAVSLSPGPYAVGDTITGFFVVKNTGGESGTWSPIGLALRGPSGENRDGGASVMMVTLDPGESTTVGFSRQLDVAGNWTGFVSGQRPSGVWESPAGATVAFTVAARVIPANGTPTTPGSISTLHHGRSFTVVGFIIKHTAGTSPVTLQFYRYQSGHWVLRKSTTAKASTVLTFSKYSDSTSVPYSGKWRVRARHKVGTHYRYSGYRTFTAS
jgi:hypothetical protein